MEFPSPNFSSPFSAPFYQPLENFEACDELFEIAKYNANIQTDKLSVFVNLFWNRNMLFGIETSMGEAYLINN